MHTRWNSIDDDRGERREIVSIHEAVRDGGLKRESFLGTEYRGRFWSSFFWNGLLFTVGMQISFLIIGVMDREVLFTSFWFGNVAVSWIIFGLIMGLINKFNGWRTVMHAKQSLLAVGHCPSCAYKLFDVASEPDGCTICPECGSAWKMD